jgi:hypothetical protein
MSTGSHLTQKGDGSLLRAMAHGWRTKVRPGLPPLGHGRLLHQRVLMHQTRLMGGHLLSSLPRHQDHQIPRHQMIGRHDAAKSKEASRLALPAGVWRSDTTLYSYTRMCWLV